MHVPPGTRALLIDGLGTLVALAPPAPRLAAELHARFGAHLSEQEAGRALAAEIAFYRTHMGDGRDAESLAALRRACAAELRAALPAGALPASVGLPALTDALLAALHFEPYGDAREALVAARRHEARVVVVSNWDVSLIEVLERVGLAPLLDAVITSAAVGAAKPAPAIFVHALAVAGVPPGDALHAGDNLAEDVGGARAARVAAVLVARDGSPRAPGVPTVRTLAELVWPSREP